MHFCSCDVRNCFYLVVALSVRQYHDTATFGPYHSDIRNCDNSCSGCIGEHITVSRYCRFCARLGDGRSTSSVCAPRPARQALTRALCAMRIRDCEDLPPTGTDSRIFAQQIQKASPSSGRFTVTRLLCCRREGFCSRHHREAELHSFGVRHRVYLWLHPRESSTVRFINTNGFWTARRRNRRRWLQP